MKNFLKIFFPSDIIKSLCFGIRTAFKKPVTIKLSKQKVKRSPHFRRHFSIDNGKNNGKCIGCKICMNVCPCNAIKIIDKNHCEFDKEKCAYCGLCEKACPKDAIKFTADLIKIDENEK